jgi:1-acyl-sn-glycerol-3-phosphate acyltransferase
MFVPVDQSSKRSSSSSILRIIHILKNNQKSFIIFPEGGRFIDGNIHKFYDGFAIVAQKTGLPVIPVYIANNRKIYPPYTFYIYNYPIKLIIGKAQYFQKDDTIETFKERIYKWFIKENSKDKISKNGD